MKKLTFLLGMLSMLLTAAAQTKDPVKWMAIYKSTGNGEGEITIVASIEKGWHTYSQRATDAGPIPTSFTFTPSGNYELIGKTQETGAHEEFVKAFDAKIYVFTDKAEFKQKIKVKGKGPVSIKVEFMCCNDMMCLPPKTQEIKVLIN